MYKKGVSSYVCVKRCVLMGVGSDDGMVHVWSVDTGEKIAVLEGGHPGSTTCVQFNPHFMTMATACSNVVCEVHMWI